MAKTFNVTGVCIPQKNYMVDTSGRIEKIIASYIREGKYFTINRARQYGKTTTLYLLEERLKEQYIVLSLSFEASDEYFESLLTLTEGLVMDISDCLAAQKVPAGIIEEWNAPIAERFPMRSLGLKISALCRNCEKKIILMIDEVDKSADNQIFLSFLGLLREKYLKQRQGKDDTFHSVILSGVYDVKNLKLKLHPEEESKYNSPWNIAADFDVDMSFSPEDIATMLAVYEEDYGTEMDISAVSRLIYDYTSGYPYLVSRICQLTDEKIAGTRDFPNRKCAWTREGILEAEALLRREPNTLFDDMTKKLMDYPKLKGMIQDILFVGSSYPFKRENPLIDLGVTFGFLKEKNGTVAIGNRIYETHLYDLFLSEMAMDSGTYRAAYMDRNQFIVGGMLQMDIVMHKFYEHFMEIYQDSDLKFLEEQGRKIFLLYLKPIINGSGNYYVEARTRDMKRTDIIVDYRGRQFVIELKIWHGEEYNKRGEQQLFEYLDYYKLDEGYLLSFNFNKNKKTGIKELRYQEKKLMEIVV